MSPESLQLAASFVSLTYEVMDASQLEPTRTNKCNTRTKRTKG
jgi:hypothetical protein